MKRSLLVTLALGVAFFLMTFPAGGNPQEKQEKTAAAGPSVVGAFPGEATLVLQVSDMASLVAKVKKSPLYQLKDRNEFAELRAKVERRRSSRQRRRAT